LSFDVGLRQTVALVGESGSGKSVTALSVMRLLPPTNSKAEGIIRLDGREVLTLSKEEMRGLRGAAASMIFQEPMMSLNPGSDHRISNRGSADQSPLARS
jgi:peptide/nickel transport system ATP-binding protein